MSKSVQFTGVYEPLEGGYGVLKVGLTADVRRMINAYLVGSEPTVEISVPALQELEEGNALTFVKTKRHKIKTVLYRAFSLRCPSNVPTDYLFAQLFKSREHVELVFYVEDEGVAQAIAGGIKAFIISLIEVWVETKRKTIFNFSSKELKSIEDYLIEVGEEDGGEHVEVAGSSFGPTGGSLDILIEDDEVPFDEDEDYDNGDDD